MALDPDLRERAVTAIRDAALDAFEGNVRSIILKGSALTEDFTPGYSDLDVHVYVPSAYLRGPRTPRLGPALAFQRAIGPLEPAAFGVDSFQVYFLDADHYPEDWSRPLPGTYELVYGEPIDDAASDTEHLQRARDTLAELPRWLETLLGRFVDKTDGSIGPVVRLAGILLKGALYSATLLATGDPGALRRMNRSDLLEAVRQGGVATAPAEAFFDRVREWPRLQDDPEALREVFRCAIEALEMIGEWAQTLPPRPEK